MAVVAGMTKTNDHAEPTKVERNFFFKPVQYILFGIDIYSMIASFFFKLLKRLSYNNIV